MIYPNITDIFILALLATLILTNVAVFLVRNGLMLPINRKRLSLESDIPTIQREESVLPLTEEIDEPKKIPEPLQTDLSLEGPRDLTEWQHDPIWTSDELLEALPELMTPQ